MGLRQEVPQVYVVGHSYPRVVVAKLYPIDVPRPQGHALSPLNRITHTLQSPRSLSSLLICIYFAVCERV